jgi:hypothetical protein
LVEVNAFNLCEPLSNKASFVLLNTAIWASLDMENPLASDNLLSLRLRYDVVHVQVLPSLHLIIAGHEPFGSVSAGHGFIIGLWLGDIGVGDIGVMTVGGDVVMWVLLGMGGWMVCLGQEVGDGNSMGVGEEGSEGGRVELSAASGSRTIHS